MTHRRYSPCTEVSLFNHFICRFTGSELALYLQSEARRIVAELEAEYAKPLDYDAYVARIPEEFEGKLQRHPLRKPLSRDNWERLSQEARRREMQQTQEAARRMNVIAKFLAPTAIYELEPHLVLNPHALLGMLIGGFGSYAPEPVRLAYDIPGSQATDVSDLFTKS